MNNNNNINKEMYKNHMEGMKINYETSKILLYEIEQTKLEYENADENFNIEFFGETLKKLVNTIYSQIIEIGSLLNYSEYYVFWKNVGKFNLLQNKLRNIIVKTRANNDGSFSTPKGRISEGHYYENIYFALEHFCEFYLNIISEITLTIDGNEYEILLESDDLSIIHKEYIKKLNESNIEKSSKEFNELLEVVNKLKEALLKITNANDLDEILSTKFTLVSLLEKIFPRLGVVNSIKRISENNTKLLPFKKLTESDFEDI